MGFKPSFLVVKRASGGNGHFYGWSAKLGNNENPNTHAFLLNTNSSDSVGTDDMDFYCNGAKPAVANGDFNANPDEYIYWAWAQHPFNGNGTSPATAY